MESHDDSGRARIAAADTLGDTAPDSLTYDPRRSELAAVTETVSSITEPSSGFVDAATAATSDRRRADGGAENAGATGAGAALGCDCDCDGPSPRRRADRGDARAMFATRAALELAGSNGNAGQTTDAGLWPSVRRRCSSAAIRCRSSASVALSCRGAACLASTSSRGTGARSPVAAAASPSPCGRDDDIDAAAGSANCAGSGGGGPCVIGCDRTGTRALRRPITKASESAVRTAASRCEP
jgi:hypothetical protein